MKRIILSFLLCIPFIFISAQGRQDDEKISALHGYTEVEMMNCGRIGTYYLVQKDKLFGVCDATGKEIIPCKSKNRISFFPEFNSFGCGNAYNKFTLFDISNEKNELILVKQQLSKINKNLYNKVCVTYKRLHNNNKIRYVYLVKYNQAGTYIYVVGNSRYEDCLFDESGNPLVNRFSRIEEILPCDAHFDENDGTWVEACTGGLYIQCSKVGYLIHEGGKKIKSFDNSDLRKNFIECFNSGIYTLNGRAIIPQNTTFSEFWGDFVIYKNYSDNTFLYGGHNYRTYSDSIPMIFSDIKRIDEDIFVRQHFYQDFSKYTPGITPTERSQYSEAEKLLMKRKYDESLAEIQSKKDRGEEIGLLDGLIVFHNIIEKYYPYGDRVANLIKRVNNNNWDYYYHKDYENDLLEFDISGMKKNFQAMEQSYSNMLKVPDISISNYLTERIQKCQKFVHLLDSMENDFISGVDFIAQKTILQEGFEEEQRQQRELAEQRRIARQQAWTAFGAALAGAVVTTVGVISNNNSRSSSVSSTKSSNSGIKSTSSYSSSSGNNESSSSQTQEKQKVMKECSQCNGTGKMPDWSVSEDTGTKTYCSDCKKDANPKHRHVKCKTCDGKGEVFDKWK